MYRRRVMAERLRRVPLALALLAAVSLLSLGARVALLGEPCRSPCRSGADHVLVFDESYYVNAARAIAGIAPPANQNYAHAPLGDDPNSEHPQLAKLLIAGSIELLGDGPLAWRLTSLVLGSVAILGMFALVRAAGGGRWLALGAAALMACDNLMLIHGRIATLDVPVLAAMVWSAVLYLRGHPILAGALVGIGSCIKLVAPYMLIVFVALELLRRLAPGDGRGRLAPGDGRVSLQRVAGRLTACAGAAAAVFVALLAILDRIAPPYDPLKKKLIASGPLHHLAHMLSYGANQQSPNGPTGIASYPWTWLVDYKPITYLNINPARPSPGLYHIHPASHFVGMISPPILLLGIPGLALALWGVIAGDCRRTVGLREPGPDTSATGEVGIVGLAWFVGTFLPFVALSLVVNRTSYIYYMVVVMPGIYVGACDLVYRVRKYRKLLVLWALLVVTAVVVMYPFTPVG
jgi:predicted membrane-bound dolichyl-phosphate-mannose-protein mannosyltransferase